MTKSTKKPKMIGCNKAAKILGVSHKVVLRMTKDLILLSVPDKKGKYMYREEYVKNLREQYDIYGPSAYYN